MQTLCVYFCGMFYSSAWAINLDLDKDDDARVLLGVPFRLAKATETRLGQRTRKERG